MAVDDRLGQTGRTRREQHAQRVIERQLSELQWPLGGGELVPSDQRRVERLGVDGIAAVGHLHHVAHGRQGGDDVGDLGTTVDVGAAVVVAADGEQHGRLDLGEALDDASFPELGGARGPRRPDAGGGEEGGERLGNVGEVADDSVAASHTKPLQPGPRPTDERRELAERQRDVGSRL